MGLRQCNHSVMRLIRFFMTGTHFLDKFGMPILLLIMRLWMAKIFWYSGQNKIISWEATVFLFEEEYKVPLIPAEIAAFFATSFELACPILLVMGLASRFATLPMIIMTLVIQFTYLDMIDHTYWIMILVTILCCGPGAISLDFFIKKRTMRRL